MKTKKCLLIILSLIFVIFMTGNILAEEPPRFEEKVAEGDLPPMENRLPEEPLEVDVFEEIGEYGGRLNIAQVGEPSVPWTLISGEGLLKHAPDHSTIIPNLAKDWEMSEDGKTFTFYLREGVRWSDGELFTVDDIVFWWDEIAMNEEVYPDGFLDRRAFHQGGWMEVEKIDDYTIAFHFPEPNPLFPRHMAHQRGWYPVMSPQHYLEQYHPDFTDRESVEERIEQKEDFDSWTEYMQQVTIYPWFGMADEFDPDIPTLNAYNVAEQGMTAWIMEANPYYWKVDAEGNQLPYIDEIRAEGVTDGEVLEGKIITGEVDYYAGWDTSIQNLSTYHSYEDEGDYRIILYDDTSQSLAIAFNLTHEEEAIREVMSDKRFRQAMSLAIDRGEISETFYFGLATNDQTTVHSTSAVYKEEYAEAYAEYNPEKANELLDEVGLHEKDDAGYRLLPDGERMRILAQLESEPHIARFELIEEYWEDIGIEVEIRSISGELLSQRTEANEVDFIGPGGIDRSVDAMFFTDSHWFAPNVGVKERGEGWPVSAEGQWENLPDEVQELVDIRDEMESTLDQDRRHELADKLLESQAENLWRISIRGTAPQEAFAKNNLRNVPEEGMWGFDGFWAYVHNSEQFFFEK